MTARLAAVLAVVLALCACTKPASPPSKLEKSCWVGGVYVPCFLVDEWRQTRWDI